MALIFDTDENLAEVKAVALGFERVRIAAMTIKAAGDEIIAIRAKWEAENRTSDVAGLDLRITPATPLYGAAAAYLA